MPRTEDRLFLGRNASVLLDVVRFSAALAVALTHMPHVFVQANGFISERSGNTAVCVFFVLSGFVIRYVTLTRETSGREYWIDRASRIYSVIVPALALTILLEGAASLHAPALYQTVASPYSWSEVPLQLVQNLTFTVGWWGTGAPPLSNGPFWSLSFECVYYVLYGLWQHAPRARWVLIPSLLLAVGPAIALLFPVWLLGAALFDVYSRLHRQSRRLSIAFAGLAVYSAIVFVVHRPLLHLLQITTVTERAALLTRFVSTSNWGRSLFHGATLHWLDRFSVSFFVTGTALVVAMLPLLLLLDRLPALTKPLASRVRLIADSTFTLYVLHLPFFIFVVTFAGGPLQSWRGGLAMLAATILLSIGLAFLFDRLKSAMRAGLRRRFTLPAQIA